MIIRYDKYKILQYFLLYICMLNTPSKASNMYGDNFIIFTAVLSAVVIALGYVRLEKNPFYILGGLCFIIFLQHVLIQNDISINSFLNTASKILISYCAVMIDKESFLRRFVKLTVIVACFSLVFFFLTQIGAESFVSSILITNHAPCRTGNISYGRFLYHHMPNYGRNVGLYNEPGVYQLYLNLALLFLLFQSKKMGLSRKQTTRYSIVLVVTIITAMSTAGYLEMFVIIALYMVSLRKKLSGKKIGFIVAAIFMLVLFAQTELFQDVFVSKLEWSDEGRFEAGTGNARLASFMIDFNYILQNPLGYGHSNVWVNTSSFASNEVGSSVGLTTYIVGYGVPIAFLTYTLYCMAFIRIGEDKIQRIALILSFVLAFSSQPWVMTPVYLTLMVYGIVKKKEEYSVNNADETHLAQKKHYYLDNY